MINLLPNHPELDSGTINLTDFHLGLSPPRYDGGLVVVLSRVPRRPRATLGDPVTSCLEFLGSILCTSGFPALRTENDGGLVVVFSKVPRRPRATLGDPVSLVDSRTTCENDGKLEVLRQAKKYLSLCHTDFNMKGGKLCCQ